MQAIDHHAWTNRWRNRHPLEKGVPTLGLLLLVCWLPPLPTALLTLLGMGLATVAGAGLSIRTFIKVLAVPSAFLLTGAPFLALSVAWADHGLSVHLSSEGVRQALEITLRSLTAISCLAFLILTTPVPDWASLFQRFGVPASIVELMLLMYRLILVCADRVVTGQRAQAARLGHVRFVRSVRSTGRLLGALFPRVLDRVRRLEQGLAARGYQGDLRVLTPEYLFSWFRLSMALSGVGGIGLLGYWLGYSRL